MKTILIILISLFAVFGAKANDATERLAQFVKNIQAFNYSFPQEKVYLHFDNTGYFGGEIIWFKAYVVTAGKNIPTNLSRILYVELLTPEGKIVDEKKLKIEDGQCHGDFTLDRMIRPGYYEIRAYTRYMLNFGDEVVFSRIFPILNPDNPDEINEKEEEKPDETSPFFDKMRRKIKHSKKEKLELYFYPEGGNLITGIPTRIAFKVTNEQGKGVDVQGTLFSGKGNEITSLKTFHDGMGVFDFIPEEIGYYIIIQKAGKKYKFELPVALSAGYNMNLIRMNESEQKIFIQKNGDLSVDTIGLAITSRGNVILFETIDSNTLPLNLKIKDNELPEGVNRLTLFDTKGEILSDRLFFVSKEQTHHLMITTDKKSYRPFEKINLSLQLSGIHEENVSVSLAVRDAGAEPQDGCENIRSNLLLSSELKGYIENPSYYFEKNDNVHRNALDLLMMVQGWRRYSWEQSVENKKLDLEHYIEKEILIKGKILSQERIPLDSIDVTIEMIGADSILYGGHYLTDREGNFIFPAGDFEGKKDLLLITDKAGEPVDTRITLDRQISPNARPYSFLEIEHSGLFKPILPEADSVNGKSILGLQHLSSVTIKGKKMRRPIVYDVAKEVSYYRDLGLDMPYWSGHTYLQYRNKSYARGDTDNMSIPYEGTLGAITGFNQQGIWREETEQTMNVNKSLIFRKIEEIEQINIIFSGELIDYFRERWPERFPKKYILILTTPFKRTIEFYMGTRYTHIQGYSKVQEFYQPDYRKNPPIKGEIDYRRTLYWNPDIKTDSNGKAKIDFYNNNSRTRLIIEAQGITPNGKLVYFER